MTTNPYLTPPAIAARYAVKVHRVLAWIRAGELTAINVGDGPRKPRWRIAPEALAEFERRRASQSTATPPPKRKRKNTAYTEYF